MMSLSIQATWLRGDIRSKLSGISKAKIKFIELSENDSIDAKEDGENLKTLLCEYGFRLPISKLLIDAINIRVMVQEMPLLV